MNFIVMVLKTKLRFSSLSAQVEFVSSEKSQVCISVQCKSKDKGVWVCFTALLFEEVSDG